MMNAPQVKLAMGGLRGSRVDGLEVFRGIPYAEPPVGPLRWRAARPHPGWGGVRDATAFGPSAPQPVREGDPVLGDHGRPPFSDDCLTLNVWTPGTSGSRPVLVWIHGGGFISGSGSLPIYSGETFARDGDLVVVSINYRLGPLGFLRLDRSEGDHWLTDQVAALRWVTDNIAAFGGDPGNLTVAGQSGGAFSAMALAGHPATRDLIRRVILQSPPLGLHLPDEEDALRTGREFLEIAGAGHLEELRDVPWERLIGATMEMLMRGVRFGHWPVPFLPVGDGVHLRRDPLALLDDARDDLDVILGWTREEAAFAFALNPMYGDATQEQVRARIAETFAGRASETYAAYAAARPGAAPLDVLVDVVTDELFRIPAIRLAESRATAGRPVWLYEFAYQSPAYGGRLGAAHCLDLPFTFANRESWSHAPLAADIPATADGLATAMHQAWISFARTGDPNHPGLPTWDRYRDTRTTMRFDTVTAPVNDPAAHWRRLHPGDGPRSA